VITASKVVDMLGVTPVYAVRLVSAGLMILSVLMFFQLLRNWLLSPGKALVGTLLFATSSWTLALGRGGHTIVAGIFLLLLVFTLSTRLFFTTRPFLDWMLLAAAVGLSLYTPLSVWLLFLAGIVWLFHLNQRQRTVPLKRWQKILVGSFLAVIIAPLIVGIVLKPEYGVALLGASEVVDSISALVLGVVDAVASIFFFSQNLSPLGLGRLPFLDIFSVFMFLLGCYYFERRLSLKRSKILFGGFTIGIVVCSISGFDAMRASLLLPLVYIFIAAGIHESISRWLSVFPKNPIARSLGIILLAVSVGFVSYYHLSRTFVVRPGNPEVRALYK